MSEENQSEKIIDRPFIFIMIGFCLFLISFVYLLTRPSINWTMNLSDKGQIGDTIGGIIGPVINLVSIVFLYISFKTQISANKIQFDQLKEDRDFNHKNNNFTSLMEIFKSLKEDYNNLIMKSGANEMYGKIALNTYIVAFRKATTPTQINTIRSQHIVKDFLFIVAQYSILMKKIDDALLNKADKELLATLVINYYNTKLSGQIDSLIKLCGEKDTMPLFKGSLEKAKDKTETLKKKYFTKTD